MVLIITTFFTSLSTEFNIPLKTLEDTWDRLIKEKRKTKVKKPISVEEKRKYKYKMELYRDNLEYTSSELKDLCIKAGLKTTGTKAQMIHRLTTGEGKVKKPKGYVGGYRFSTVSADIMEKKNRSLIDKIRSGCVKFKVARNKHGNYENTETGIVVDRTTSVARGVQLSDGTVRQLYSEDIEKCREFNVEYEVAEELNRTITQSVQEQERMRSTHRRRLRGR